MDLCNIRYYLIVINNIYAFEPVLGRFLFSSYDWNVGCRDGCRPQDGAGAHVLTPRIPAVIKMRFSVCRNDPFRNHVRSLRTHVTVCPAQTVNVSVKGGGGVLWLCKCGLLLFQQPRGPTQLKHRRKGGWEVTEWVQNIGASFYHHLVSQEKQKKLWQYFSFIF